METGMSIAPQLQTGCSQPYVAIPVQFVYNCKANLQFIINQLTDWLSCNSVKIAGPLFYRYWAQGCLNNLLGIEVGYPVATIVQGNGLVIAGSIPKGTFATLVHGGQPGAIETTLETMHSWAGRQGLQWKHSLQNGQSVWAGCFEFYLTHPADVAHLSQCRTAVALLTTD